MSELRINNITDRAGSSGGQLLLVYQQSHQHHTWSCQVVIQKCVVVEEEVCFVVVQSPTIVDTMDTIEIATTGNATDFGDLSDARVPTGLVELHQQLVDFCWRIIHQQQYHTIDFVIFSSQWWCNDFGDLSSIINKFANQMVNGW